MSSKTFNLKKNRQKMGDELESCKLQNHKKNVCKLRKTAFVLEVIDSDSATQIKMKLNT